MSKNFCLNEILEKSKKDMSKYLLFAFGEICKSSTKKSKNFLLKSTLSSLENYLFISSLEEEEEVDIDFHMNKLIQYPSLIKFNSFLIRFGFSTDQATFHKLKELLLKNSFSPNHETFELMIRFLGKNYEDLNKQNDIENKEIFSTLCSYFDYELTEIINYFCKIYVFIDINIQNSIFEVLISLNRQTDAWNNYLSMKLNFSPNQDTYRILFEGIFNKDLMSNDLLDFGLSLLAESKEIYRPSESVLRCLYNSCTKNKCIDKIEEIFEIIRQNENLDENSFVSLINAYGKFYNIEKANQTIEEMKKRFQPSVRSYESLIKVLLRFKAIDKCEKLLEEVTQRKLDNSTIICILLNGFKENKLYEKAIELYEEHVIFTSRLPDSENLSNFNLLFECCIEAGRKDLIDELYLLITRNINLRFSKIDIRTYINLIKGLELLESTDKIIEVSSLILSKTEECNNEILNILMEYFKKQNDEEQIYKIHCELLRKNIVLTLSTYEYLSSLYSKNSSRSYSLFDELNKNNIKPSLNVYQFLLKTQLDSDNIERAITIFKNMILNNIVAEFMLYDLMIKSCLKFKRTKDSADFTIHAIKNNVILGETIYYKIIDEIISDEGVKSLERADIMSEFVEELKNKNFSLRQNVKEKVDRFIYIQSNGGGNIYYSSSIYNLKTETKKNYNNSFYKGNRNINNNPENSYNKYPYSYVKQNFNPSIYRSEKSLYNTKIY